MNRQKQILFVLVIGLLLSSLYAYWSSPQQKTVSSSPGRVQGQREVVDSASKSAVDLQQVHLGLLDLGKKKYAGYKRDIFNYYQPKPKPAPKPVVQSTPKPVVRPEPPKPATTITPQVRQQLARFTFLGFLVKERERTIFLSNRDELFLVKAKTFFGENNQFEVVEVNEEMMTIKQAGASGLIEIKLVEEEPLIPSFSPGEIETINEKVPRAGQPPNSSGPGAGVPAAEKRRNWFKNAQPEPAE